MKRTILSIDDHALIRLGLRLALTQRFENRFALAEATDLEGGLQQMRDHPEDVALVILDLQLGDARGLGGLQLMREHHPEVPVVVLSASRDQRVQDEARALGASDYVCKTGDGTELERLMRAVERITSSDALPQAPRRPTRRALGVYEDRLGKRQVQVLELILAGHDNQAIVWETGLTLGSVKNCVSSIFLVFNVRSRAELIGLFAG
ncbi:MAG: response regulator transcription factor [Hydrogenophaga sp.]|uniref:response regulator transcription factor n=1 Tax=Hydrogenophaga sp. TaxID=1904254 RepID=UPI001E12B56B|nr:response regulator transcription factor [Hydrogenophaga sp.]MBX3608927.1 response regulator transcription factor [Hydrogenophaga sp.]